MSSHERLACLHARPIRNKAQPTADWARGMQVTCLPCVPDQLQALISIISTPAYGTIFI